MRPYFTNRKAFAMKDNLKKIAHSTKNNITATVKHVHRNRAKYAAATTAAGFLVLMNHHAKEWNAFLEEKGIDPREYYYPEYFEELNK